MRDPRMTDERFERGVYDEGPGYGSQREADRGIGYERGSTRRPFERATERSYDYGQRDFGESEFGERTFPRAWEGPFRGVGPRNFARTDDRIREDVCERLAMHGGVDARNIDVEVVRAEVVLRGSVTDRRMKRMAEDAVDAVPGVRDVRNELRVEGGAAERGMPSGPQAPAASTGPMPGAARSAAMPATTARRTVFGIFSDSDRAEDAVNELREAGFDRNDISLVARSEREARQAAGSSGAEAKGAGAGALLGGIAGGALGWLVGVGALAIPGVGPIVALGALGTTVAGVAAGAVAGGLIGVLVGLGVPEEQAKTYEAAIKKGGILVSCGCEDDREVQRARDILQRTGASEVRDYDSREAKRRLEEERLVERGQGEKQRAEVR